ncbi:acetylxylan esterase [Flavobacterium gilvum]|uniref:Acetylxylan esterase n=1 Tax=Flavobacterium gilvum TaxID=1492737 RepID=A0AAC9N534_9FLAO|nr:acetylxylan esterase [Flavobacterium gilvum]AOW09146.1 acetylxylan esterase [Flavobacterium gilvum]KFC60867.1 cephalosporin-C deacetylase [Flavobacterium gilvum]
MKKKIFFLTLIICVLSLTIHGQNQPEKLIKIVVSPDHSDWNYKIGEPVKFNVGVYQDGVVCKDVKIDYEVGPENFEKSKIKSLNLADGKLLIDGGTMREPGFLRCIVRTEINGVKYKNLATVGFDQVNIKPFTELPEDFIQFWENAKSELAGFPIDPKLVLMPEKCTEKVNVYQLNIQGYGRGSRIYGILCIPKKEGKYPALLKVPGAGIRPYNGVVELAEQGVITLEIGIHGIPVTMNPEIYSNLSNGALNNYQNFNLDDKNRFYYKRVYLNCVRANDFLVSLPQFDGENLVVTGGSQGGALSIVTAGLDKRVKFLATLYPALCDLTASLKGRAGGWPHYFEKSDLNFNNKPDKIKTCSYYDVVNFAKQVKIPTFFSLGYNDEVCPPSSMYAAYNSITSPKDIVPFPETGHWENAEQNGVLNKWLLNKIKVN